MNDIASLTGPTIAAHLSAVLKQPVMLESSQSLTAAGNSETPLSIVNKLSLRLGNGTRKQIVLRQLNPGEYGLEQPEDRARHILYLARTAAQVPGYAELLDFGVFDATGRLHSLSGCGEFYVLEEFVEGRRYGEEFDTLRSACAASDRDRDVARSLADYLAALHRIDGHEDRTLYRRALRDLVGGGEGVMGLIDGYPPAFADRHSDLLQQLELACVAGVQRLRGTTRKVRATHGDFHPWNILLDTDGDIRTIDKSRADPNDPAVDVGSMLMNYLMLAFWQCWHGGAQRSLTTPAGIVLARDFLTRYRNASDDEGIARALPVYTAMRSAAVASPVFYPDMPEKLRTNVFSFATELAVLPEIDPDMETLTALFARWSGR